MPCSSSLPTALPPTCLRLPFGGLLLGSLAVVFLAPSPRALAQGVGLPTQLNVHLGQGQTFLTWLELPDPAVSYRVYRSGQPLLSANDLSGAVLLGEVDSLSSTNLRLTELTGQALPLTIVEGGPPLEPEIGLFVHTQQLPGSAYYAVTAVAQGNEDLVLVPGQNSTLNPVAETPAPPRPILQQGASGLNVYVHWVSNLDTPFAPAMSSQPSQAFNLQVRYDPLLGSGPRPVLLQMHERGGNFLTLPEASEPTAIAFAPDDWLRTPPFNSFWYGTNPAYPGPIVATSPPNVDYTVRRVLFELDWVLETFPVDTARVYAAGPSMGGAAAISLAYRYPSRFAAAAALVPKFDWGCQAQNCWQTPEAGDLLWGPLSLNLPCSEGISTYDRLDAGFLLNRSPLDLTQTDPLVARPPILTLSGRQDDVVGWPEKPVFYAALQAARQPGICLWDDGTHTGDGRSANGPWKQAYALLESELWKYRRDQPQPAFSNFDLDGDPGNGDPLDGDLIGSINAQITFDADSLIETAAQHRVLVRLRSGTGLEAALVNEARVDWTPRGLEKFKPEPSCPVRFENLSLASGQLIQTGLVKPDAEGLYTMPRALVNTTGNRWVLRNTSTAPYGFNLPSPNSLKLDVSGAVKLGATPTFVLSGMDASASDPLLALSLGSSSLPFAGGILLVDPAKLFLAFNAPLAGSIAQFPLPIPTSLSLVGRIFFAQGVVTSLLGPQGVLLSNGLEVAICP